MHENFFIEFVLPCRNGQGRLYLTVAGTPVMKATNLPLELTRTPSTQSSW